VPSVSLWFTPWMSFMKETDQLAEALRRKGIRSKKVLEVMAKTPRHKFIEKSQGPFAYEDHALPIEAGQTISQPYVVARMTEALLEGHDAKNVLEIGTGSGYQAAILSKLVDKVYSIERIRRLYDHAQQTLKDLNYANVELKYGDGNLGWDEHAPFDGIIVTAGADSVPQALLDQLSQEGGRLVIPVGAGGFQELQLITRNKNQYTTRTLDAVLFVPLLTGIEE